jgi:alpha-D-xyloside xylohydrolase
MPYIYSLAGHSYHHDYTIMRGLMMDFANDVNVKNIGDEYMFGPSILVAPVYTDKATSREVYLPAGTEWFDFYTGKKYQGGKQYAVDAPLERLPLFVKAGSIIPAGPQMQYTTEKAADPITLYVFAGQDASFTLYEDENTNYNYEKGQFSSIDFKYDEAKQTLTIGERKGSFTGMLANRKFEIVWVDDHRGGVGLTAQPHQVVTYSGTSLQVPITKQNNN